MGLTASGVDVVVIGGGAAGFFAALEIARRKPVKKIIILEKSGKLLSKVRISGGGRCNVTHACFEPTPLSLHYPRGQKQLKKLFRQFQATDTVAWFKQKNVVLKTEDDGRMFPTTDSSETIIDCLMMAARASRISIELNWGVDSIVRQDNDFIVSDGKDRSIRTKKIVIAIGGHPQQHTYKWIADLGHAIVSPVPSLFTFNNPAAAFKDLMGVAVNDAEVRIAGTKLSQRGPVLITHWGLSGPAVIKLSAWAAEHLKELNYEFTALVNWTGSYTEDSLRDKLIEYRSLHNRKVINGNTMFSLPQRLWERLISLAEIDQKKVWGDASNKDINRLIEFLIRCPFIIKGKTTFKEEFVTCGGVDLAGVDVDTMQSKLVPGLYFAGEVLNMDGETGGFNFQAAWTTAFVAATDLGNKSW